MLSTWNHFKYKDTDRLKVKGCRKVHQANTNQKKYGKVYINSGQDRFLNKANNQWCRGALHNDRAVNPPRKH